MAEYIEKETAIRALLNDSPEQVSYSREDAADCKGKRKTAKGYIWSYCNSKMDLEAADA